MTAKDSKKTEAKTVELQDEQLDKVSGGGLKLKSSPDNLRDNRTGALSSSSKSLYNDAAG